MDMSDKLLHQLYDHVSKGETPPTELMAQVDGYLGSIPLPYDANFGDDKVCTCGHVYYRHFDSWDDMSPCGCKYCGCHKFTLLEDGQFIIKFDILDRNFKQIVESTDAKTAVSEHFYKFFLEPFGTGKHISVPERTIDIGEEPHRTLYLPHIRVVDSKGQKYRGEDLL